MKGIAYAKNVYQWEPWMHVYRWGSFYILPPKDIAESVNELRKVYDPKSYGICGTHISLNEILPAPLTEGRIAELQQTLSTVRPFEIHYGPLYTVTHLNIPGVNYTITPVEQFLDLRRRIHSTSAFKSTKPSRTEVPPHMTIAEFISIEESQRLFEELHGKVPEGTFTCCSIECLVPDENFYFRPVMSIPLMNGLSMPLM